MMGGPALGLSGSARRGVLLFGACPVDGPPLRVPGVAGGLVVGPGGGGGGVVVVVGGR